MVFFIFDGVSYFQTRYATTSVTYGNFARPLHIAEFSSKVYAGLQMLNFKNDALRKRFDSVKYDVKKMEEIVYDLTIRGLAVVGTKN